LALTRLANAAALFLHVLPTPLRGYCFAVRQNERQLPYGSGKSKGEVSMVKKQGVYDACKAKVLAIQEAYDEFVNTVEEYKALLTSLIEDSDPNDVDDKHLLVVANLQRNTTNGLINTLDTDIHDDLTRLSDRVIRFKHWEDGLFV
jgi:hypothetical protein